MHTDAALSSNVTSYELSVPTSTWTSSHTDHTYAPSLLQTHKFQSKPTENRDFFKFQQNSHLLVCVTKCLLRFDELLNVAAHSLHLNGFSPLCTKLWIFSDSLLRNDFPHSWHTYGLLVVCRSLWRFSLLRSVNDLWQTEQLYGLVPEWTNRWISKWDLLMNSLLQISHWYGLLPVRQIKRLVKWGGYSEKLG